MRHLGNRAGIVVTSALRSVMAVLLVFGVAAAPAAPSEPSEKRGTGVRGEAAQLGADSGELDAVVARVQRRYERLVDLRGEFTQRREMPGGRVLRARGTLYVKTPGRMRWEYEEPERRLLVATGDAIYWYEPRHNQVQVLQSEALDPSRTPTLFLSGRGDLQREFQAFPADWGEPLRPDNVQVRLVPREEAGGFESLILEIRPESGLLDRLVEIPLIGSPVEYRFSELEVDVGLAPSLFEFRTPPDAEVVYLGS